MALRLIDDRMKRYVELVDEAQNLLSTLKDHPWHYLSNDYLAKDTYLGTRSFLWTIYALEELFLDPSISYALSEKDVIEINEYFSRHLLLTELKKNPDRDSFWLLSACQAFAVLHRLNDIYYKKSDYPASFKEIKNAYSDASAFIIEIMRDLDDHPFGWYLAYWTTLALRWLGGPTSKDDQEQVLKVQQIARGRLERQLSLHHVDSAAANRIELAIATSIVWDSPKKDKKAERQIRELEVKKGVELCCSPIAHLLGKRLVIKTEDDGELHNLAWEELFIIGDLPAQYFPEDLEIFADVMDFIRARIVQRQDDVWGLADESSDAFPAAAGYFSNYCIVLLSRIKRILRARLRDRLVAGVKRLDPSNVIETPEFDLSLDSDNLTETHESTYLHIKEKIPQTLTVFQKKLKTFNTMLFFGPPGTGKTTLLEVLINYLNTKELHAFSMPHSEQQEWIGITFAPSYFLVDDAFSRILDNITDIFSVVLHIDHCIFFFDEAEELIRSRITDDQRFGRMFTAAMLLYLNRLKHGLSIFIFATNYINEMDPAAIRKGRFAIRKGLGWVHDSEITKLIDQRFEHATDADAKSELARRLPKRPIKEIIDIQKELERLYEDRELTKDMIADFFQNKWKDYLSLDITQEHVEDCIKFDDTYREPR